MLRVILVVMALAASTAHADDWRTEDTQRETAYMVLHAMDWAQTLQIRHHADIIEGGFVAGAVIGQRPTNAQVNAYMVGSAILQYAIAANLPHKYRAAFQYISIVDSGASVANNFSVGLSIGIKF